MFALKLARASGLRIILSSSSDEKLEKMKKKFTNPPIQTINYNKNPNWHEEVLKITGNVGVDIVVENGGTGSLVKSMKCTRRGGIISQVGYLSKQDPNDLVGLIETTIDRRIVLRLVTFRLYSPFLSFFFFFFFFVYDSGLLLTYISYKYSYRGINAGSKYDMEDFCAALSATEMQLDDLIDSVFPFEQAEEAVQNIWEGKQIGKIVLSL